MKRIIELDPDRIMNRDDMQTYMNETFLFEEDCGKSLDGLADSLSEVSDDVTLIISRDAISQICQNPYPYKVLMVLGDAAEHNPHLHILFRD